MALSQEQQNIKAGFELLTDQVKLRYPSLKGTAELSAYTGDLTEIATLQQGRYTYDATSTAPLTGQVIIASSVPGATPTTGRWILQQDTYSVRLFGARGNGTTDDTAAIRLALSGVVAGEVYFPRGVYKVSGITTMANDLRVRFNSGAIVNLVNDLPANNVANNDMRYVFIPGSRNELIAADIRCNGFQAGGICSLGQTDVKYDRCKVSNWTGMLFGLADLACNQVWYSKSTAYRGYHGFHSYKSTNVTFSENTSSVMVGGGIYTAWSYRVSVVGNFVYDCGDVGIDFEGGALCTSSFNTVEACNIAELALFSGNKEDTRAVDMLIHQNNTIHRRATYISGFDGNGNPVNTPVAQTAGAMALMSSAAGCQEVGFRGNSVTVDTGVGFFHNQLGDDDESRSDRRVFCDNNTIVSSAGFFRCLNSVGLRMYKNQFIGKAGSEGSQNELRDASGLIFKKNDFRYEVTKTGGYALLLNTNSVYTPAGGSETPWAKKPAHVSQNTFSGTGGLSIKVDLFRNGNLTPTLHDNDLGGDYTTGGGLAITPNGNVVLKAQKLRYKLPMGSTDLSTIDAINRAGILKAVGDVGIGRVGYNGLLASLYIVRGTGNINANSRIECPAAGLNVTTGNSNVLGLVADSSGTGSGIFGYMDLTVNSY